MATYGKKLLDSEGNIILPKTRSSLVYMDDNSTVEDKISSILSEITKIKDGTTVVGKATKLATARNIGNASFDGSEDITLAQIGAATTAQGTKADNAMPKSGGQMNGHLIAYQGSALNFGVFNIEAKNAAEGPVDTSWYIAIRQ